MSSDKYYQFEAEKYNIKVELELHGLTVYHILWKLYNIAFISHMYIIGNKQCNNFLMN